MANAKPATSGKGRKTFDLLMAAYFRYVDPFFVRSRKRARLRTFGYQRESDLPSVTLNVQGCSGMNPRCVKRMEQFRHTALRYDMQSAETPDARAALRSAATIVDLHRYADYATYEAAIRARSPRTMPKMQRALREGYTVRRFALPMHVYDVHAVKTSMPVRAGGPMLAYWLLKPEDIATPAQRPVEPVPPACPWHWTLWWGVFAPAPGHHQGPLRTDERLVAYTKLARFGEVAHYQDLMCHKDHLEGGAMVLMHLEITRWLMESDEAVARRVRAIWYGAAEHGRDGLLTWKRRIGFEPARCLIEASPLQDPGPRAGTKPLSRRASSGGAAKMHKIVSLCKRRGFIFPSSEIYGGLNGAWDYGPLGAELKRNLKACWWSAMTRTRDDIVGFDGSILMNRAVWQASGHETTFSDPLIDCKTCQARFRADQLESSACGLKPSQSPARCGGELTKPRTFNLMFKTYVGSVEDESAVTYLRPETAQAMFVQFQNVLGVARKKLPFGIAQIGKAFRNEINPRNFTFRSREFEQMEVEFFVKPGTGPEWLEKWKEERLAWYESIGLPREKIHVLTVPDADRAFYSQGTYDLEYEFPFGVQELEGIAHRGDYDLRRHQEHSKKPLEYFDEERKQSYLPEVVEPSAGVDRTLLAILCEAYAEEKMTNKSGMDRTRVILRLSPRLAPIKAGIFPLLKNRPALVAKAKEVQALLRPLMKVAYDASGSIGKRYRRMDEAGTPFGLTIDFETLEGVKGATLSAAGTPIESGQTETVTIRARDTMKQERIAIADLPAFLLTKIA